jgi:hypothetical protein
MGTGGLERPKLLPKTAGHIAKTFFLVFFRPKKTHSAV